VEKFLQTLVSSLSIGSLYALIALGYTLVYGILRFINFAHSDIVTLGCWLTVTFAGWLGWQTTDSPALALPIILVMTMGACAAIGVTIEWLAYRPLRRSPRLNVLITAIGVSLFLQNFGQLKAVFGPNYASSPELLLDRTLFEVSGVPIRFVDVVIIALAVGLVFALEILVFRTRLGRGMRAVSFDERIAALMGVDVNRVVSLTFAIGSALAAAGGLIFTLKYPKIGQTADTTWVLLGLKAFVAAVVGGIGNVRGAALGALLIAGVEQFGAAYFSTKLQDVYVFLILIAVLLVKPSGLLGRAVTEKV
jgi:branched-chain amino acid transport system permease protein